MTTFIIGLIILIVGGVLYGKFCEKVFCPDNRTTPAIAKEDGVDYVPMNKWKNSLIQILNIAGTGPILGPIQGILFGPIAFITIPIGCIIGGAFHDYISGMISVRSDGKQMPGLVKTFLGEKTYLVYNVFVTLLMILVGAVFIYTPGDLFITQVLNQDSSVTNPIVWIVYGGIFVYYLIATLFPIDKIIGKVYPIFGGILLLSAVGVFIGIFVSGYQLEEIWQVSVFNYNTSGLNFFPIFFVTVACGIVSGFHSTQSTMIARTIKHEKEGRMVFFNMMILEGFIAMTWAAAAMGIFASGVSTATSAISVVGLIAKDLLGSVGGMIAIIGVIVLPITSGDTALRSLRLMLADTFKIDQTSKQKRLLLSSCIFAIVALLIIWAKFSSDGFNILWRYFAWSNQTIAVFTFSIAAVYLMQNKKCPIMALVPGMFYMFVISSYILNATIGFGLSWTISYIIGGALTIAYGIVVYLSGKKSVTNSPLAENL